MIWIQAAPKFRELIDLIGDLVCGPLGQAVATGSALLSLGMGSFTSGAQSKKGRRVSAIRLARGRGWGPPLRGRVKETLEATA